jgi:membrane protein DedA with SNARE-associated domain
MAWLSEWATQIMNAVSQGSLPALLGLFLIAAVMEIGVPIPFILDSTILFVSLSQGFISFPVLLVVMVLFAGRFVGASILYWAGRLLGGFFLKWLEKRRPQVTDRINSVSRRLNQSPPLVPAGAGPITRLLAALSVIFRVPMVILLARFTPGLLTVSSLAAGGICLNYRSFVLGLGLSSILADGLVLTVGYLSSQGLKILGFTPANWQLIIGVALLIPLGWAIFFTLKKRRGSKDK